MRRGFVINEMLIALMIILVLAGGYMLNTNWMHGLAEEKADAQTAASLGMLVTQYKLHMGAYPSKLADLTKKMQRGTVLTFRKFRKTAMETILVIHTITQDLLYGETVKTVKMILVMD